MPLVAIALACGGFGASGSVSARSFVLREERRERGQPHTARGAAEQRAPVGGGAHDYSRVVNSSRLSSVRATPNHTASSFAPSSRCR